MPVGGDSHGLRRIGARRQRQLRKLGRPPDAGIAAVKASARRFIDVYAAGDEKSVCTSLTQQALTRSRTFCDPRSIFYTRKPDPQVQQYSIAGATTNGDTATATIRFQTTTEQIALLKLGGQWKIDTQLGAGRLF